MSLKKPIILSFIFDNPIALLFYLILFGCQAKQEVNQSADYEAYVNRIINSFAKEMKKEFGFICCGSGGRMPFDVEEIELDFSSHRPATVEEARHLEIVATEKFLDAINSDEKIRPFLKIYPFTVDRAQISIAFYQPNGKRYIDGSVALVFQARNKIFYRRYDEASFRLIALRDESYDEALKIVRESSQ